MFNIKLSTSNMDRSQDYRNILLALTSWFIVDQLRTKTPMVDPVLAKIYFDTYAIPIGEDVQNIKEAASEYEADIIRFFLLNQRERCCDIMSNISSIFRGTNIVLPIQCKPFFEEIMSLSEKLGQHNIQTKESQVLDSLRDTIVANSMEVQRTMSQNIGRINVPPHHPVSTSGKYILTDGEKAAYVMILNKIVNNLYLPLFSKVIGSAKPNVYGLTDIYEDSGTRFAKVIEYLKSALFMICTSYDEQFCSWVTPTISTSIVEDRFSVIEGYAGKCRTLEGYDESISKECARYGGFTIPQAICLPLNTPAHLDCFKSEKNAISLTYKFLVCQAYQKLLGYESESPHA